MTTTLTCAHCGGALGRGDHFCAQCGAELFACAYCGESLLPQDESCPECGTPAEHRPPADPLSFQTADAPTPWADMVDRLRRATLGEYELGRELGRGGMAAVFLAHEISLARKVAIKVMSPGLLLDDGMIDRFRHEAVTIAHLHHPNIVSVYSVRQAEGLHFFVMQYVQGRSLEQVIHGGGPLPLPIVRSVLFQVGSALTYAHRCRVIHRDIKPANILIDGDGNAVVTDFGIAKAAETPSRTLTGALVGTPAYMSPEQCRGIEISGASDQYSLGAVAYEMLTGAPPFSGSTLTVMQAHVEKSPAPIRDISAACPPDVEAAVLRMLSKNPADRWPRIADAMAALGAAPLAEDDPLRAELSRLAAPIGALSLSEDLTPTSPAPLTRRSSEGVATTGTAVSTIAVLPPPANLEVGDSFVLVATVRGRQGVCLPPNDVTWSCDPPDVLRFGSGGGEAVAVGAGTTLLIATCKGVQAILRVDVSPARADEITIAPLDHGVAVGEEIRLETVVRDKRGQPIERRVSWQSDDAAIARVTAEGELVAVAPGFTKITATLDSARANVVIPVLPARVAAIRVEEPQAVPAGRSFAVVATPVDRWGSPLPGRRVRWSSSDVRVAMPTAEGRVHTMHPGSVVLTASCEGVSESVRLSVEEPDAAASAAGIDAQEEPRRVRLRRSRRSRRQWATAAAIGVAIGVGSWWYSTRPRAPQPPKPTPISVAEAPSEALAEPAPAGSAEVASVNVTPTPTPPPLVSKRRAPRPTPKAASADSAASAAPAPTDSAIPTGVAVDTATPATAEALPEPPIVEVRVQGAKALTVGQTLALSAEIKDSTGRMVTGRRVLWSSSNPAIAAVDAISGTVVARSAGSVQITGTSEGIFGTAAITVGPEPSRDRQKIETKILAGVAQCYAALKSRDAGRLTELYHPATSQDRENLKKLSSILRTREWSADIGDRVDGLRQIGPETAAMEFSFQLGWKDAFGGRLRSQVRFRAAFSRADDRWDLTSCRIVGSPKL
jgi:serine/threonine protein kinase